jgi:hypothetical protein
MSDLKNKCIAAVASVVMTAAILVSISAMAESSGVPGWIKAAEAKAISSASATEGTAIRTASMVAKAPA